jgi:hypothetical protein
VKEGWDGISKEGDGIAKPVTMWAVEIDGKIYASDIVSTRATARYIRQIEEEYGHKAHVRKVQIIPVKGR